MRVNDLQHPLDHGYRYDRSRDGDVIGIKANLVLRRVK